MKHPDPADFPELRKALSGYLHEDFLVEHGSPLAALKSFAADADAGERQRFQDEVRRFLDATAAMDFDDVRTLLARLGARWTPPSREALAAALHAVGRKR